MIKKESHEDTKLKRAKDRESERIKTDTSQKQKIKFHRVLNDNSHEYTDKIKYLSACLISDCKNHQLVFEENFFFSSSSEKKSDDDAEVKVRTKTTMTAAINYQSET